MNTVSEYAVALDLHCKGYSTEEMKKYYFIYLSRLQNNFNDLLRKKGYVFLRDIYEILELPITQKSIIVGWYYDPNNVVSDNFIYFDIQCNDETCITVDFNVDGEILSRFK